MPRPCVLVVDDDASVRRLLATTFEPDHDVLLAEDGRQALEVLRGAERVDAVVLDVMMPEVDGLEVLAEIREDDRLRGVPVVVITASMEQAVQERARELGCDTFLRKPFSPEVLVSTVALLVATSDV